MSHIDGIEYSAMHARGPLRGGLRHGSWTVTDDAGTSRIEGRFRDGLEHGLFTYRSAAGSVESTVRWRHGERIESVRFDEHGARRTRLRRLADGTERSEMWSSDGMLLRRESRRDGALDGACEVWTSDGRRESLVRFNEGRRHGMCTWWHGDGTVSYRGRFVEGTPVGRHVATDAIGSSHLTKYDGAGQVIHSRRTMGSTVIARIEARPDGRRRELTLQPNGTSVVSRFHRNAAGDYDGEAFHFNVDGEVLLGTTHVDKQRHGPTTVRLIDGARLDVRMVAGKADGECTVSRPDGSPVWTAEFRDGVLHGQCTVWDASGTIIRSGAFADGQPVGEWSYEDPSGSASTRITFDGGRPLLPATIRDASGRATRIRSRAHWRRAVWTGPLNDIRVDADLAPDLPHTMRDIARTENARVRRAVRAHLGDAAGEPVVLTSSITTRGEVQLLRVAGDVWISSDLGFRGELTKVRAPSLDAQRPLRIVDTHVDPESDALLISTDPDGRDGGVHCILLDTRSGARLDSTHTILQTVLGLHRGSIIGTDRANDLDSIVEVDAAGTRRVLDLGDEIHIHCAEPPLRGISYRIRTGEETRDVILDLDTGTKTDITNIRPYSAIGMTRLRSCGDRILMICSNRLVAEFDLDSRTWRQLHDPPLGTWIHDAWFDGDTLVLVERTGAEARIVVRAASGAERILPKQIRRITVDPLTSDALLFSAEDIRLLRPKSRSTRVLRRRSVAAHRVIESEVHAADGAAIPVTTLVPRSWSGAGRVAVDVYGGFGLGLSGIPPRYGQQLLDMGVPVVTAHVRGGDELGPSWWEQGRRSLKLRSSMDMVECARALPRLLGSDDLDIVYTGTSGGALVAAIAMEIDPELPRAVVLRSPLLDFGGTTSWPNEYDITGAPTTAVEWSRCTISPLHMMTPGHRPDLLVLTGLHDTRTPAEAAARYVRRYRRLAENRPTAWLVIDRDSGHAPTSDSRDAHLMDAAFTEFINRLS